MELYLPVERPGRNPVNGQFLKGHRTFNKGLKWEDYLDMRKAGRMKEGLLLGRIGNPNLAGWNRKRVVGVRDGRISVYESAASAGRRLGVCARNIRHCCNGKRARCAGIRWFDFDSDEWCELVER